MQTTDAGASVTMLFAVQMKNERPPKLLIVSRTRRRWSGTREFLDKEFTLLYLLYLILASIIGDDSRVHVLFGTLTLFLMHERLAKGQPTPTQESVK